jgi:6-phosphogluconolactonase
MKAQMGTGDLHIFPDVQRLIEAFSAYVKSLVTLQDRPFNMALSGGSTPIRWFDHLARHEKNWQHWVQVGFFWGDERCVSPDSPESNFGMARQHLFSKIRRISEDQIHRIKGEMEPGSAAAAYEKELMRRLPRQNGIPQFDLVILGLGEDGHTASIFPDQIDLWEEARICVVATHPDSGQKRVSVTGRIINHARHVAVLATGEKKSSRIEEILYRKSDFQRLPGSLINPTSGQLHWYLDQEAGKLIKA